MTEIRHIGKSADDLRFFILEGGAHAGGVTVHSIEGTSFSYGVAVAPHMRRKGVAGSALRLLFEEMKARGFTHAVVRVAPDNAASLALHASLGFSAVEKSDSAVTLSRSI